MRPYIPLVLLLLSGETAAQQGRSFTGAECEAGICNPGVWYSADSPSLTIHTNSPVFQIGPGGSIRGPITIRDAKGNTVLDLQEGQSLSVPKAAPR